MNNYTQEQPKDLVAHIIADIEFNNYSVTDVTDIEWVVDYSLNELGITKNKNQFKFLIAEHFQIDIIQ